MRPFMAELDAGDGVRARREPKVVIVLIVLDPHEEEGVTRCIFEISPKMRRRLPQIDCGPGVHMQFEQEVQPVVLNRPSEMARRVRKRP